MNMARLNIIKVLNGDQYESTQKSVEHNFKVIT
jgi:hypothetical protein